MNETAVKMIWFKLIHNKDIKDLLDMTKTSHYLKELDINSLYFYEDSIYYSPLESFLVDLTGVGYPVGYTVDLLRDILKDYYSNKEVEVLRDNAVLDLFKIVVNRGA